jgi:hypothetical protein
VGVFLLGAVDQMANPLKTAAISMVVGLAVAAGGTNAGLAASGAPLPAAAYLKHDCVESTLGWGQVTRFAYSRTKAACYVWATSSPYCGNKLCWDYIVTGAVPATISYTMGAPCRLTITLRQRGHIYQREQRVLGDLFHRNSQRNIGIYCPPGDLGRVVQFWKQIGARDYGAAWDNLLPAHKKFISRQKYIDCLEGENFSGFTFAAVNLIGFYDNSGLFMDGFGNGPQVERIKVGLTLVYTDGIVEPRALSLDVALDGYRWYWLMSDSFFIAEPAAWKASGSCPEGVA